MHSKREGSTSGCRKKSGGFRKTPRKPEKHHTNAKFCHWPPSRSRDIIQVHGTDMIIAWVSTFRIFHIFFLSYDSYRNIPVQNTESQCKNKFVGKFYFYKMQLHVSITARWPVCMKMRDGVSQNQAVVRRSWAFVVAKTNSVSNLWLLCRKQFTISLFCQYKCQINVAIVSWISLRNRPAWRCVRSLCGFGAVCVRL